LAGHGFLIKVWVLEAKYLKSGDHEAGNTGGILGTPCGIPVTGLHPDPRLSHHRKRS